MPNQYWTKSFYKDPLKHGTHPVYHQVSPSRPYPFSSTRQDSKKYAEFMSCGRKTVGRVK